VKARCVGLEDGSVDFTLGKVYEVDEYDKLDSFPYHIMGDNGKKYWCHKDNFELLPDEPAPKSDWMRCDEFTFVNMVTGMCLEFEDTDSEDERSVKVGAIHGQKGYYIVAEGHFSDAFAALVGYKWD
jgi:hypothetical protein